MAIKWECESHPTAVSFQVCNDDIYIFDFFQGWGIASDLLF